MSNPGGGKIRPRRTHTTKKPYSRPKPSGGLFGRVKSTLSHLTPSWLAHMWNPASDEDKEDVEEPGEENQRQTRRRVSFESGSSEISRTQENSSELPSQSSGLGPSFKSPPQVPFFRYEPLTSSTPIEGEQVEDDNVAGKAEKEDSNSDESISTSGCSSLVPHVGKIDYKDKERVDQKMASERKSKKDRENREQKRGLWSDFGTSSGRVSSIGQAQQPGRSSTKPSFNASYFGSPLYSSDAVTPPITPGGSSFYPGRTSFGGASTQRSAKRRRTSPYEIYQPVKRQMRPKPVNSTADDYGETSVTAKRILDTLERMSTPLSDARRIPVVPSSSPLSFTPFGKGASRNKSHGGSFLTLRTDLTMKTAPPVFGLRTPLLARISKNRQPPAQTVSKPKQTQEEAKVPVSTTSVTASTEPSKSTFSGFGSTGVTTITSTPLSSLSAAAEPSTKESSLSKSGGKMKTKSRTNLHYSVGKDEEDEVEPDLPQHIPLPLADTKPLPKFDLSVPAPSVTKTTSSSTSKQSQWTTSTPAVTAPTSEASFKFAPSASPEISFKFASPIAKESVDRVPSDLQDTAQPTFQFSVPKPVSQDESKSPNVNFKVQEETPFKVKKLPEKAQTSNTEEENTSIGGGLKPAKELKSGSCLEVFGIKSSSSVKSKEQSSLSSGSKDSPVTVNDDNASTKQTTGKSIWDKTPASGSWECPVCMIYNTNDKNNCAACGENKPGHKEETQTPILSSIFGAKPSPGSWECPTCMIMNSSDVSKCPCCETVKPGSQPESSAAPIAFGASKPLSLAERFKPPSGSWECPTCCIQNKSDVKNCVACGKTKPGESQNESAPKFKFGTASDSSTKANSTFKFGGSASESTTKSTFKFGDSSDTTTTTTANFKFGAQNSVPSSEKVGASSEVTGSIFSKQKTDMWVCDTCWVQNKASDKKCVACQTPVPGTQATLDSPPKSTFTFGASETSSTSPATGTAPSGFTFGGMSTFPTSELSTKPLSQANNTPANVSVVDGKTDSSVPSITLGTGLAAAKDSTPQITFETKPAEQSKDLESVKPSLGGLVSKSESSNNNSNVSLASNVIFAPKTDSTSVSSSFAFGQVKTTDSAPSATGFTFGQKTETAVSAKVLPTPKESKAETSGFSFGGTAAPFQFGAAASEGRDKTTSIQSSVVANGNSKTEAAKPAAPVYPFTGNTSETTAKPSSGTGFTANTDIKPEETKGKGGFAFNTGGSTTNQATPTAAAPGTGGFAFAATSKGTGGTSTDAGSSGLFSGAAAATPVFNFTGGASTTKPSTTATPQSTTVPPFQFSAGTSSQPPAPTGSSTASQGLTGSSGIFGQSGTAGFGAAQQNSFGGFQFSTSAATTTTASSTPAFGSGTAPAFGSGMSGTSAFGATSSFGSQTTSANTGTAAAAAAPAFGSISAGTPAAAAAPAAPAFGSAAPAFGTNPAASTQQTAGASGFSFGTNPSGSFSSGSSVFQFSAGKDSAPAPQAGTTPTPTQSVGFSAPQPAGGFNAAPSTGAPPAYNFTASTPTPNTFNFSGNQTTTPSNPFSASGSVAGRKIKRPIRRIK
ncbi:nuclear pore complex protein Nup153-like isoform X3 [Ptychodera flava]|uniref:nuclear pore complex protein Nup153-like isoform X3 n=1 Tax=Ptychodera flava TaxID=63121 RepID=UPI003969C523